MADISFAIEKDDLDFREFNDNGYATFETDPLNLLVAGTTTIKAKLVVRLKKGTSTNSGFIELSSIEYQLITMGTSKAVEVTSSSGSVTVTGMSSSSMTSSKVIHPTAPPSSSNYEGWVVWSISNCSTWQSSFGSDGKIKFSCKAPSVSFKVSTGQTGTISSGSAEFKFLFYTIKYQKRTSSAYYRQDKVPAWWLYTIRDEDEHSYEYQSSQKYSIDYNTDGGESISSRSVTESYRAKRTFTNFRDNRGYPFDVYEKWDAKADITLTQEYGAEEIVSYSTNAKFGSLPTAWKIGYQPSKVWLNGNGASVLAEDLLRESPFSTDNEHIRHVVIHPEYIPREYTIKFTLASDEGKGSLPDPGDSINNYVVQKTFGIRAAIPEIVPVLNGYLFKGWTNSTANISPRDYRQGDDLSDLAYLWDCKWYPDQKNHHAHVSTVVMKPAWELNPIKVKGYYYLVDNYPTPAKIFDQEFNITTKTRGEEAFYLTAPNADRGGDYVFLGWVDTQPDNWTKSTEVNNGFCGAYAIPPDTILDISEPPIPMPIELPVRFSTKNRTDWGTEKGYYGIWAKTGKYLKLTDTKWVKINKMYVKTDDNKWKVISDVWTKVDDTHWKHEI